MLKVRGHWESSDSCSHGDDAVVPINTVVELRSVFRCFFKLRYFNVFIVVQVCAVTLWFSGGE